MDFRSNTRFPEVFVRHEGNPIITMADIPYPVNTVFNPGATKFGDDTLLLMRVEDRRGISHLTVARSTDGKTGWRIDPEPTLLPDPVNFPEEHWGIEDPRITWHEEDRQYLIAYTSYSMGGPLVSLATTEDFRTFRRRGPIMPPEDKDAAIFPIRFGPQQRYAIIHRPSPSRSEIGAHMWLSYSPDLLHWGEHNILISARRGAWWDANKIGLSPPPLRTEQGWLILYHGVKDTPSGAIYRLGVALLDLEDPGKLLRRSDDWVFAPHAPYEVEGDVHDVVFPCGWVLEGDEIRLYYGAADTSIALATASLSELMAWLQNHSFGF